MKIGFIGTGVMGTGIIENLLKSDADVNVYNRTKAHAQQVLDHGAKWAASPRELAENSDLVLTMVGYPQDVEDVYFGDDGLFKAAHRGQYFVDMTTSKPSLAKKIFDHGQELGVHVLDAPVSGGDVGAKNGTLTVMVGGKQADFEKLQPVFQQFSSSATYFGPAGAGQNTKMANQIMIAGTMTGMTEMLVYAKKAGLDLPMVCQTLQSGAAENFSLGTYGPRILRDDYTPGFFAKHFLKDLRIALEEADEMGLDLSATKQEKQLYEQLVDDRKLGNDGTQALIKLWWH